MKRLLAVQATSCATTFVCHNQNYAMAKLTALPMTMRPIAMVSSRADIFKK